MDAMVLTENGAIQQLLTHISSESILNGSKYVFYFYAFHSIVLKYLAQLYCVCIVWNSLDTNQLTNIDSNQIDDEQNYPRLIWLKYEAVYSTQSIVDDLVRLGIDSGCQVKENMKFTVIMDMSQGENHFKLATNRKIKLKNIQTNCVQKKIKLCSSIIFCGAAANQSQCLVDK